MNLVKATGTIGGKFLLVSKAPGTMGRKLTNRVRAPQAAALSDVNGAMVFLG